jgi:hypothetical protein
MLLETEQQAEARIRDMRVRRALKDAPDVARHVRSIAVGGQIERGETLPEWTAPMRITAADDLDSFYSQLLDWVSYWSQVLGSMPPATTVMAWTLRNRDIQGFKANTTPEGAGILVKLNTGWLLARAERIAAHESGQVFQDDVNGLLWRLRSAYGLTPDRVRPVRARACPVCREYQIGTQWLSLDLRDVVVRCAQCGYQVAAETYPDLSLWIDDEED